MASEAPPPYNPAYAPQQPPPAGYDPYPPPQDPYPPQPYPPQPYPPQSYPPQPYPPQPNYQGYPAPTYPAQQQQQSNVVVVQQQAPTVVRTVRDDRPNHLLHCVITFFCPIWIFVWIIVCCVYGC